MRTVRALSAAPVAPAWTATVVIWLWAAALPLAAYASRDPRSAVHDLAAVVYAMGHVLCHQQPARSFSWGGQPWPVCARCTGIYVGAAVGVLLAAVLPRRRLPEATRVRRWLAASALPSVLTLVYEWTSGAMPGHGWRATAGGVMGSVAAALIIWFLREPPVAAAPALPRA